MKKQPTRCEKDDWVIPSRQQVQIIPDDKSLKIKNYHRACAPRRAPKGWSRWDTMNNSISAMFFGVK